MDQVKDTLRALVRIGYDGRVYKTFRGPKAQERFDNEVRVLRHLEERGCPFVPRLLEADPAQLAHRHHQLRQPGGPSRRGAARRSSSPSSMPYGVRHDDAEMRNVTYRQSDGRFCLIDFEFATILRRAREPSTSMDHRRVTLRRPQRAPLVRADRPGPRPRRTTRTRFSRLQFNAQEVHHLGKIGEALDRRTPILSSP